MEYDCKMYIDHGQNMMPAAHMEVPSYQHHHMQNIQQFYEPFQNNPVPVLNIEPQPVIPITPVITDYPNCDNNSYNEVPVCLDKAAVTKSCLKRYLAHSFQNNHRRGRNHHSKAG
jgi:hypothetical protein